MNTIKHVVLAFALTTITVTSHADGTATFQPLRPASSCIRTDRIDEWHVVDDKTVLVRTGPIRYELNLLNRCSKLGAYGPAGIHFRANESNRLTNLGRICGEAGEAVSSRFQPPCAIQSVHIIDKPTFDALSAKAAHHGNGAQPSKRVGK